MNFKPTWLKVIVTVLVAGLLSFRVHALFFPCKPIVTDIPGLSVDPICAFVPPYALSTFWGVVGILLIITYTLWSIVAKKP